MLNSTIQRALNSAGSPSRLEPRDLCRDEKNLRPDGKTHVPWANGQTLAWDATCVDTLAYSYVGGTCETAGFAAKKTEERKVEKYQGLSGARCFQPIAVETFGAPGSSTETFLDQLGGLIAKKTGEPRSRQYLSQRLSIDIQRGNAASVLGTLPQSRSLDEVLLVLESDRNKNVQSDLL